jgi:hypothetical protein
MSSMLSNLLKDLIKGISNKKNTNSIEESLSKWIDSLPDQSEFSEIGVSAASRICSYVPMMRTSTAASIIKLFFSKYGAKSLILLSSINCGRVGVDSLKVIEPFLSFPLLREAFSACQVEEGSFDVDWPAMVESKTKRILELENIIASLKATPSPLAGKSIAWPPSKPEKLNENIIRASQFGDIESVAYLIFKDPSLVNQRDANNSLLIHNPLRFPSQQNSVILQSSPF